MRLADLVHELLPVQAKAENRHPDDRLAAENDPVLTKTVVSGGESGEMPSAVDLDDEADVGPGNVQVHTTRRSAPRSARRDLDNTPS